MGTKTFYIKRIPAAVVTVFFVIAAPCFAFGNVVTKVRYHRGYQHRSVPHKTAQTFVRKLWARNKGVDYAKTPEPLRFLQRYLAKIGPRVERVAAELDFDVLVHHATRYGKIPGFRLFLPKGFDLRKQRLVEPIVVAPVSLFGGHSMNHVLGAALRKHEGKRAVIDVSLRGFDRSVERPPLTPRQGLHTIGHEIANLARLLDLMNPHFFGASLGAITACHAAAELGEKSASVCGVFMPNPSTENHAEVIKKHYDLTAQVAAKTLGKFRMTEDFRQCPGAVQYVLEAIQHVLPEHRGYWTKLMYGVGETLYNPLFENATVGGFLALLMRYVDPAQLRREGANLDTALTRISQKHVPAAFVAGEEDKLATYEMIERSAELARGQIFTIDKAKHTSIALSERTAKAAIELHSDLIESLQLTAPLQNTVTPQVATGLAQ